MKEAQSALPGFGRNDIDIIVAQQFLDAEPFCSVVLDDQQPPLARLRVIFDSAKVCVQFLSGGRLAQESKCAARQRMLAVFIERDDLYWNVARERVLLQLAKNR